MAVNQGRRSRRLNIKLVNWQRQVTVSGIIHMYIHVQLYILYLRRKNAIYTCNLVHESVISTTLAGEWLNNLIFHDDIKCITANG